ncbi:hypothetical protein KI387_027350, partial [Taxus chinensis]
RFGDIPSQLLDANQAAILKSTPSHLQPSGQGLHTTAGNMSTAMQQVQALNQQLPGTTQDNKNEMNAVLNQRSTATDPSLFGVSGAGLLKSSLLNPGINQGPNTLPLNGLPVGQGGIDQLRSGLLQSQKSYVHSPRQYQQFNMLSREQQQIVLAQGNLSSASGTAILNEMDSRNLRMILSNRNAAMNKDGQPNAVGDVAHNTGSPMQAASPLSRGTTSDPDFLFKMKLAFQQRQQHQQQQQLLTQQAQSTQQSQVAHPHQQQDKTGGALTIDSSLSNSFRGNDQVYGVMEPSPSTNSTGTGKASSKGQARKRKQPGSSSGPAISSGTVNNTGPSPSSAPSTPSSNTPGDVMSMPHSGSSSKPLILYGPDGVLASPSNQLADLDRIGEDGSLDDNVESFLSHDETAGRSTDSKVFSFEEVGLIKASTSKVVCCHFSSDGKLLASAGHEKKAVLWNMDTLKQESTLEEHNHLITDVRFSPNLARLATSSFDRTVRVWDADNPPSDSDSSLTKVVYIPSGLACISPKQRIHISFVSLVGLLAVLQKAKNSETTKLLISTLLTSVHVALTSNSNLRANPNIQQKFPHSINISLQGIAYIIAFTEENKVNRDRMLDHRPKNLCYQEKPKGAHVSAWKRFGNAKRSSDFDASTTTLSQLSLLGIDEEESGSFAQGMESGASESGAANGVHGDYYEKNLDDIF